MKRALVAAFALLVGCGGGADPEAAPGPPPPGVLAVQPAGAFPSMTPVGKVTHVAELVGRTALFGELGAAWMDGGVSTTPDASVMSWRGVAEVPSATDRGAWLLAVDGKGRVLRVLQQQTMTALEDVSDRFGLVGTDVRSVARLDDSHTAFGFPTGFAVSDGSKVTRYDDAAFAMLSGGAGRAVAVGAGQVKSFAVAGTLMTFAVPSVTAAVVGDGGKIVASTEHQVLEEDGGQLAVRYDVKAGGIRSLTSAGQRVWFVVGTELGALEGGKVSITTGAAVEADAVLVGSGATGDVWKLAGGKVARFSAGAPISDDEAAWRKTIIPVFSVTCGACHGPGGSAGYDLSTYGSWAARRDLIAKRVLVDKTMPPSGTAISDAERDAVKLWTGK